MAELTRPAPWEDVKLRYLDEAGATYALVDPSPENARRWIGAPSRLPDGAAAELAGEEDIFVREGPYAVRIGDELTVDVLPSACGHLWEELAPHVEEVELEDGQRRVLGLEGLLLTKEGARDRDEADRRLLEAALRQRRPP